MSQKVLLTFQFLTALVVGVVYGIAGTLIYQDFYPEEPRMLVLPKDRSIRYHLPQEGRFPRMGWICIMEDNSFQEPLEFTDGTVECPSPYFYRPNGQNHARFNRSL